MILKGFDDPVTAYDLHPRSMIDLDALEAAGIANARERTGLIEYLDGLGFTTEEMVEAERRGRLFGLAGDAIRRSGRPTYSLRTAAESLGLPLEDVTHFWAMLGLTVPGPDDVALSQADVDALATCAAMKANMGDDGGSTAPHRRRYGPAGGGRDDIAADLVGPTSGSPAATTNSPPRGPGANWLN